MPSDASIIEELKSAGYIRTAEDEAAAYTAIQAELQKRKTAEYYLADTAEASYAFFRDFVVPVKWRESLGVIHREGSEFITDTKFQQKLILWPREHLKALALDTPIPTPSGFTAMLDIEVGDSVFGQNGVPTKVTGISDVMFSQECYEVEFSTGDTIICDGDHLWVTDARRDRDAKHRHPALKRSSPSVKTAREIAGSVFIRGEHNHRIPIAGPLDTPAVDLPIDPYVLGAWLGDGHSSGAAITNADFQIIEEIRNAGEPVTSTVTPLLYRFNGGRDHPDFCSHTKSFKSKLNRADLVGNKHIPSIYLRASFAQRLSLLQGLMDTDGSISKAGQCFFSNMNHRLVEQIRELVCSLGLKSSPIYEWDAILNGKNCGPCKTISFYSYPELNPFRLKRKADRVRERRKTSMQTYLHIVGVRLVAPRFVKCITVDAPDGVFLAGSGFIPTHNSTQFTIGEAVRLAIKDPNLRFHINHHKHKKSMKFLGGIKGVLLKDSVVQTFGYLLPDLKDKYRRDNEEELTLATRTDLSIREATFTTGGVDKADTSGHFDYIISDDLITEFNSNNMEQIEKALEYWRSLLDLLDKERGIMWVIGTRHHLHDLYGVILDEFVDADCKIMDPGGHMVEDVVHQSECNCDFDVSIKGLQDADGNYIYPSRFNDKMADKLLRQKGRHNFAKQYWNNPTDPSLCFLKTNEVKGALIDPSVWMEMDLRNELIKIQLVDPAESKKKRSAYTAIVTIGIHKKTGVWYIIGATKVRVDPREFVPLIFEEHRRHRPNEFGMESNTRKAMRTLLEDRMMAEKYFFTIKDLNPSSSDGPDEKQRRFKQVVVPLFQYHRILVDNTLKDMIAFLETVPSCKYWDLGDCLSYAPELAPVIAQDAVRQQLPRRTIHFRGCGY